jgi:MFS family permease
LLLAVVASGVVVNPLNSSMMAVAIVVMQPVFDIDFREASLLISVFYVASAVGQPVMGRLADRLGRKQLFLSGLVVVIAASAAAPFAPGFGWLLAIRALQAVGSSTLYPSSFGIVRDSIRERQGQAIGVLAIFAGVGAALGPTLAGALLSTFPWYAVFAVNAPLGAIVLVLAWRVLPRDADHGAIARPRTHHEWLDALDPPGLLLFTVALVSLLWFLLTVPVGAAWWTLATGAAASILLVRRELRAREPMIDLPTLLENRALIAIYAQYTLVNVVFYSVVFGIPTYLQVSEGLEPVTAGLIVLPLSGVGVMILPAVGRIIDRFGPRRPLVAGTVFMLGGSLALLGVDSDRGLGIVIGALVVFGLANGLNNLGLQAALYQTATAAKMSAAAGLLQTSRYLGTILATCLLGIVFSRVVTPAELHAAALVLVVISAATLALSWHQRASGRASARVTVGEY